MSGGAALQTGFRRREGSSGKAGSTRYGGVVMPRGSGDSPPRRPAQRPEARDLRGSAASVLTGMDSSSFKALASEASK
jgi:hypothetical protein